MIGRRCISTGGNYLTRHGFFLIIAIQGSVSVSGGRFAAGGKPLKRFPGVFPDCHYPELSAFVETPADKKLWVMTRLFATMTSRLQENKESQTARRVLCAVCVIGILG